MDAITTPRLQLVPVLGAHAAAMYPVLADESLYAFTGGVPPRGEPELVEWFTGLEGRRSPDGEEQWLTWILELAGEAIGYVQATVSDDGADIAWLVGKRWQRNGYAPEAATALVHWLKDNGIRAIRAHVHPEHGASQSVARAVGLAPSGQIAGVEETWVLVGP